jgi:branched-chain amino acid aminotransferase
VGATEEVKLYVIMCPVGPYYPEGFKPVKLLADTNHVRAWPGGVGNAKLGGNYGPTIAPQMAAQRQGCQQILWLFGEEHRVTEVCLFGNSVHCLTVVRTSKVGAMNILFFWVNEDGERELITAPLDTGDILPGAYG